MFPYRVVSMDPYKNSNKFIPQGVELIPLSSPHSQKQHLKFDNVFLNVAVACFVSVYPELVLGFFLFICDI